MTISDGSVSTVDAVVVGSGPAGLMAADVLSAVGVSVLLCDRMPSLGRKFLRAGVGGLNLTHSEPAVEFVSRYSGSCDVSSWLQGFAAEDVIQLCQSLGIDTFAGSSGRVFPVQFKASPMLRAWLARLQKQGVNLATRHELQSRAFKDGSWQLEFTTPEGPHIVSCRVCVLALGGGSWAKLGSDGRWLTRMRAEGVACADFQASNCGVEIPWSGYLIDRFEGQAVKPIALRVSSQPGTSSGKSEALLTRYGLEGSAVYGLSSAIRAALQQCGEAELYCDLLPDHSEQQIATLLERPRGKRSLTEWLRRTLRLSPIKIALLTEVLGQHVSDSNRLPVALKRLPLRVRALRPLDEAISTAGGILADALTPELMLRTQPGVFCAGEMLDWDAPTGGYLITACLASGRVAGQGALDYLGAQSFQNNQLSEQYVVN